MRSGAAQAAASAALFGATIPLVVVLSEHMSPLTLAGTLYTGAGVATLARAARQKLPTSRGASLTADRARVAAAIVLGGGFAPYLYTLGAGRTGAAGSGVLLNSELAATVLLASLVAKEKLGARSLAGIALIAGAGAALSGGGQRIDLGALAIIAACVLWAVDNIATSMIDQYTPDQVMAMKGLVAGPTMLILAAAAGQQPHTAGPQALAAAAAVGAVGYGLSPVLWVHAAHSIGAARAQAVFALAPFIGAAGGWLILSEPVTPTIAIAFAVAATGVALCLTRHHTHEHDHEQYDHTHLHDHTEPGEHHKHHGAAEEGHHEHQHHHPASRHTHEHTEDLHHRH